LWCWSNHCCANTKISKQISQLEKTKLERQKLNNKRSFMQDSYNLKLINPILEPAERSVKAALISAGMGVSSETVEKLLTSNGLLLKPQSIQSVNDIAAKFKAAGVDVEVVPHLEQATQPKANANSRFSQPLKSVAVNKIKTPEATFGKRAQGWLSLRWKILPLAILPVLLLGGAWLTDTFTSRAKTSEGLLVRGALQTAALFSRQVLSGVDDATGGLNTPVNLAIIQQNVVDLFKAQVLPLTHVAVTDTTGKLIAVYDQDFSGNEVGASKYNDPVGTYTKLAPDNVRTIEQIGALNISQDTKNALQFAENPNSKNPFAQIFTDISGKSEYIVAYPIENKLGSVHLALDARTIGEPAARSINLTLIVLGITLVLVSGIASYFANLISKRMTDLANLADKVSMGDLEQPISASSKDEIGDLAQALERMRISLRAAVARFSRK
jgi:HAMP domain-containing protein